VNNKRRNFLKSACAPVVFSIFGIPLIEACSKSDDGGSSTPVTNSGSSLDNSSSSENSSSGLKIDLTNSNFSSLTAVGGWMNYTEQGLLLLRVDANEIRAFSNRCPHQGSQNSWSYSNSRFRCATHGRSFEDSCSGALTCYTTSIEGNILTVNK
tara:strand:+ start:1139 stop:1600 length:462 start_codon:yes stop_codon:yes gene_type:complete